MASRKVPCLICRGSGRISVSLGWGEIFLGRCLPCKGRGRLIVDFQSLTTAGSPSGLRQRAHTPESLVRIQRPQSRSARVESRAA